MASQPNQRRCLLCRAVLNSHQGFNEHTMQCHLGTVCYYPGSTRHLVRENDVEMANQLAGAKWDAKDFPILESSSTTLPGSSLRTGFDADTGDLKT
ncbi:hypothetical protein Hte_001535 [Hypoxylon texense]